MRLSSAPLLRICAGLGCLSICLATGCKSAPPPPKPLAVSIATQYPARPSVAPPPLKLFHKTDSTFTLVTKDDASDEEIVAAVYALRDAARNRAFDALHIPQKAVDAGGSTVWFHIYRGTKCAAEKYAAGAPPCGGSYHAAADYTLGTPRNPHWDDGVLLHNTNAKSDDRETPLWNPDAAAGHP